MELQELQKIIDQSIKEAHLMGLQSGKKETSGLVDLIMHKLESKIEESITKNVNGKIIRLTEKVDSYILLDTQWKEADEKWKEDASPAIDVVKNMQGFGKVSLYIIGFVASLTGLLITFINFFHKDL